MQPIAAAPTRSQRTDARFLRISAILCGALLLTWPALLNRYPLLYPDSVGYLQDGRPTAAAIFLHRLAGYAAQRSEFYSLGIFPFHWNLTPWPIVALNALLTSFVLYLTVRSVVAAYTARYFFAITAFLSLLTSASWYVSLLMPDILGALLYLAIYLLVFARETLSRSERFTLNVLCVWAMTAHSTHLMLSLGLWLLLAMLMLLQRSVRRSPLRQWFPQLMPVTITHLLLLIAIAGGAQAALHDYLYGRPSLDGSRPPYLMARIIADGPGAHYLRQHCATSDSPPASNSPAPSPPGLNWAICAHVNHLPDNDDEFLWSAGGIWSASDRVTQRQLLAEEMPLVVATLRAYPMEQIAVSWSNFTHQLNDFGVNDFDNNAWMQASIESPLPGSRAAYARSMQAHDAVPSNRFSILQRWVVLASAVFLVAALFLRSMLPGRLIRSVRGPEFGIDRARIPGLALIVIPTLIANALITGVLSSSDSRYQARVIWLLPLLAALTVVSVFEQTTYAAGREWPGVRW